MSVANPVIASIDGTLRRIYLLQGVSDFYPIEDIYHEYRYRRRTDESLRKFNALLRAEGNVPKGGGAFTPRYVVLLEGTKIVPYDETLQLNQLGDMITDNPDVDATLYDISGLTVPKPIFIKPSEAEIIQLSDTFIEYSSFDNGVTIDPVGGQAGTTGVIGNRQFPVNNIADALTIATNRGLNKLYIRGTVVVTNADISGYILEGENPISSVVVLSGTGNMTTATSFSNMILTGRVNGHVYCHEVALQTLSNIGSNVFPTVFRECIFRSDNGAVPMLQMRNDLTGMENVHFFDCVSGVPGNQQATIDYNGSDAKMGVRRFSGGMAVKNYTAGQESTVEMDAGRLIVDSSSTSGTIVLRGNGIRVGTTGGLVIDEQNKVMDANIVQVNNLDVNGSGTENDPWGPA